MIEISLYKFKINNWIVSNPHASEEQLRNYCEQVLPVNKLVALSWLIECSVNWQKYRFHRNDILNTSDPDFDDVYDYLQKKKKRLQSQK